MGRSRNVPADVRAWAESFLKFRPILARIVSRFVRPHEIEDIVQETFIRSYVAGQKQVIRNPHAFMAKTAKNLALDSLNRAENRLNDSMEEFLESELFTQEHTPESECQSQEQFLIFCRAVAELPVRCRRAFILRKVYGLSLKETADYLRISESTVKKHIVRGMLTVIQKMSDKGYSAAFLEESSPDSRSAGGVKKP